MTVSILLSPLAGRVVCFLLKSSSRLNQISKEITAMRKILGAGVLALCGFLFQAMPASAQTVALRAPLLGGTR